ncbi:hypothetical protein [Bifidobacterium psychraerophilum]|jgi:hypothetical protein|uniref:hypothetical protein n=1 Tax=Bifidobacterium psychraerophilum TaxID=218140 RepID=UPI0023EFA333|nr:hypothetical protein [Bifidobacterium psychraerophilum]MCI1660201.1 hypothetical protein [Bifidobacterium psychraerophilum]MCI1804165.1 hypothetical protein [Bifidobacterium psychraerophilum]MCI2176475.1 hypothetical protein [Bifidobacterium psychraerophilum]MCI2181991.1 hypothetical protein [Bifidobacterium psychraerophilum]
MRTLIRYEHNDEGSGKLTDLGCTEQSLTHLFKRWTSEPALTLRTGTLDRLDEGFAA